jgi:hypothetical protein
MIGSTPSAKAFTVSQSFDHNVDHNGGGLWWRLVDPTAAETRVPGVQVEGVGLL